MIQIEIWSDVVCPFCYIGKRKLERAIEELGIAQQITIDWKSYQLDPLAPTTTEFDCYDYLANRYGKDRQWSIEMHKQVSETAKEVGLDYQFDSAVPCNTKMAHELAHFAKSKGKGNQMEELLFHSYFTNGKNLNELETLVTLATELGLDESETRKILGAEQFKTAVENDIQEAQEIGVRGVPFFVFNRKFAVSGAQAVETFKEALTKALS